MVELSEVGLLLLGLVEQHLRLRLHHVLDVPVVLPLHLFVELPEFVLVGLLSLDLALLVLVQHFEVVVVLRSLLGSDAPFDGLFLLDLCTQGTSIVELLSEFLLASLLLALRSLLVHLLGLDHFDFSFELLFLAEGFELLKINLAQLIPLSNAVLLLLLHQLVEVGLLLLPDGGFLHSLLPHEVSLPFLVF